MNEKEDIELAPALPHGTDVDWQRVGAILTDDSQPAASASGGGSSTSVVRVVEFSRQEEGLFKMAVLYLILSGVMFLITGYATHMTPMIAAGWTCWFMLFMLFLYQPVMTARLSATVRQYAPHMIADAIEPVTTVLYCLCCAGLFCMAVLRFIDKPLTDNQSFTAVALGFMFVAAPGTVVVVFRRCRRDRAASQ